MKILPKHLGCAFALMYICVLPAANAISGRLSTDPKSVTLLIENTDEQAWVLARRFVYGGEYSGSEVKAVIKNEKGEVMLCRVRITASDLPDERKCVLFPGEVIGVRYPLNDFIRDYRLSPGPYTIVLIYRAYLTEPGSYTEPITTNEVSFTVQTEAGK